VTSFPKTGPKQTSNATYKQGGPVMKKSKYIETDIVYALKQAEAGVPVQEVAR
jgi:hypothetical protein